MDIDEIIARRREKRGEGEAKKDVAEVDGESVNEEEDAEEMQFEDEDDEFMAEDGFGMGVASDEDESGDENLPEDLDEEEAQDGEESDDESIASAVPHPNDIAGDSSDE